jgi:hypothetical protein
MSNPTSNFNWQMPTNTDLVTDLPADFEVFGQAVDTSLADLKGGTTGQILSKATGADMDFTWITNDVGDITAVTAGTGITGGGTSGAVTVSFDQANFGGGQFAAGKNKIINGDMGIWQRGTSTTLTTNVHGFGPDRFRAYVTFSAGSSTYAQQTFTPGTAPVAGYEGTFFSRVTCGSTSTYAEISQKIENVRTFAAQTATLSFWAKSSAAIVFTPYLIQQFGSGGSGDVATAGSNVTLTTSWVRYTATISVPSITGKTIGTNGCLLAALAYSSGTLNSATIDLWGVQVEAGSTATPFQTATGTIQGELAACKRYFKTYRGDATYLFMQLPTGINISTTRMIMSLPFDVSMRSVPTVTISNLKMGYSGNTITAAGINQMSNDNGSFSAAGLFFDVASGQTAGAAEFVYGNNSASAKLDLSSEL